jgi:hypothetical protein
MFKTPIKSWMTIADCRELCMKNTDLLLEGQLSDLMYCFGMSKMLVVEEVAVNNRS